MPAAPLFRQISDLLVRQIATGALLAGERLPPERDLARDHNVAVGTVRRALSDLQAQGLIETRHGSGNYVRDVRDLGGLYGFFRLELPHGAGLPDATLISVQCLEKPHGSPAFGSSAFAHRIRRVRSIDRISAAIEEIWLDQHRAPSLSADVITPSLYRTYRTQFGLRITRVEDRIGTASLPGWGAKPLDLGANAVVGHVERVSYAQDGLPCEFSRTWFDSDKVRYVNRLK